MRNPVGERFGNQVRQRATGAVARAVDRHRVQLGWQSRNDGFPVGGGDPVDSFATVDLHLSYRFGDTTLFLDGTNVLDEEPPQYNTFAIGGNNGVGVAAYDPINASPLGRVFTIGVRTRF